MSAAAACSFPDNPGTTILTPGMLHPHHPAAAAGLHGAELKMKSKRVRRKELRPPQRACSENYTGLLDTMPIQMHHGTKPIVDYATPIVIQPQAEREPGRMDRLFNKGQFNMCSQYTDFHCTYNSQSTSPSLPRDPVMYDGYQDSGVGYDGGTPPPANSAGGFQNGSPVEQLNSCGIKYEENPALGTVTMGQSAPIVIEPVVDDMAQMQQVYGSTHTTPSRNPAYMTSVPQGCLNGVNSCYQTPPPLHQWPRHGYVGYCGQYAALGTLTPYYPVTTFHLQSRNDHISPPRQNPHQWLSPKMMNSSLWRDNAHVRPGHPYHSTPPPAQHTMIPRPLGIQPMSMHPHNVPCPTPPQANYKPEDDDRAVMMRCYAKKERETSVNISGTCYLHGDDMTGIHKEDLSVPWCTQNLQMSVENQIVEFDVDEREMSLKSQKADPRSEKEPINDHYRSLEKQLPRFVKAHINSLIDKAAKHEGGIFFDYAVNMDLMHIEQACTKLSAFNHKLVYEHLSQHLPCSKETLQRHAETLASAVVRRKLRNLLDSLSHRLEKEMPYQMERHLWECSVATKLQFQQQAMIAQSPTKGRPDIMAVKHQQRSSSEPVDQHHMPRQTFLWTDVTRQLIWDILKTKLSTFPSKKGVKAKMANFERLKEFVQRRVVTAWPEGWMTTEMVLAESRKVQQTLRGTTDLLVH